MKNAILAAMAAVSPFLCSLGDNQRVVEMATKIEIASTVIDIQNRPIHTMDRNYIEVDIDSVLYTFASVYDSLWSQYRSYTDDKSATYRGLEEALVGALNVNSRAVSTAVAFQSKSVATKKDVFRINTDIKTLSSKIDKINETISSTEIKEALSKIQQEFDSSMKRAVKEAQELKRAIDSQSSEIKTISQNLQVLVSKIALLQHASASLSAYSPIAVGSFLSEGGVPMNVNSNNWCELSKFMGWEKESFDSAEPDKWEAPLLFGSEEEKANNLLMYLNSYGLVAFQSSESEGKSFPFTNQFREETAELTDGPVTNIVASFNAPKNWADSSTIVVTNGHFALNPEYMMMRDGYAWSVDEHSTNKLQVTRCYVQAGGRIIKAEDFVASEVGPYYAHIAAPNDIVGSHVTVNRTSFGSDNEIVFLVGETNEYGEGEERIKVWNGCGTVPLIMTYW